MIEVDGITHEEKKGYDEAREQWIVQNGYKILKFVGFIPFPDDRIYEYIWGKISEIEAGTVPVIVVTLD